MSVAFNQIFQKTLPDPTNPNKTMHFNPFDVYNLGKAGSHRRVNHDPLTASAMSFLAHGIKGAQLGNLHVLLDVMSEQIKKEHGVIGRDLFEAHTNYILENSVLPTIIEKRKMLGMMTNGAYNNAKRQYHSNSMRAKSGRMGHRQNLHKAFIPTKAFYR